MTRILHLSDLHVSARGPDADGVDGLAALDGILADARHVPAIDAVVVSGDLSDDGSVEGCRQAVGRVAAFAESRGIAQFYAIGNHDDRSAFHQVVGSGHRHALLDPMHPVVSPADASMCAADSRIDGLRIITLDSVVVGETHGLLGQEQLAWLTRRLADPAPRGTVLVVHHPPLQVASMPWVEHIALRNSPELAAAVQHSDVRAILSGHLHCQVSGALAGIPVWVAPGVVTRIDTTALPTMMRGVLGAGAAVVDLPADGTPTFHQLIGRDPRAGHEVYLYDPFARRRVDREADLSL